MNAPDRYVSFCGLDCAQRAEDLVGRIQRLVHTHEADNRFWQLFVRRMDAAGAPDALFLVHAYIFYMRELLEKHADHFALALLDAIETDCC